MTAYISPEQGLRVAKIAVGGPIEVRDLGLLEAALQRQQTSLFDLDPRDDDSAYDLVIAVASGKLTEVDEIADVLRIFT